METILKEGSWSSSEQNEIIKTTRTAYEAYSGNLDKMVNYMHFNLEMAFGKRIQIIIFEKKSTEGHCLHAIDGKYIEIEYNGLVFVVWKVKLIEDEADEKYY